jgi:hypothetical protein
MAYIGRLERHDSIKIPLPPLEELCPFHGSTFLVALRGSKAAMGSLKSSTGMKADLYWVSSYAFRTTASLL